MYELLPGGILWSKGVDDVGGGGMGEWEDRKQMRREGEQEGGLLWDTKESTWWPSPSSDIIRVVTV